MNLFYSMASEAGLVYDAEVDRDSRWELEGEWDGVAEQSLKFERQISCSHDRSVQDCCPCGSGPANAELGPQATRARARSISQRFLTMSTVVPRLGRTTSPDPRLRPRISSVISFIPVPITTIHNNPSLSIHLDSFNHSHSRLR